MRVALCQIPVSPDPAVNIGRVHAALASAAHDGADLAVFPEATQARFGTDLRGVAEPADGPFGIGRRRGRDHWVALVAGVFEPAPDGRVYNTAVAFDAAGELVAAYRKIHLFDSLGQTSRTWSLPAGPRGRPGGDSHRPPDLLRHPVPRARPEAGG